MNESDLSGSGPMVGRRRAKALPFAALLLATAFFRSTQNAVQTTIGPFGHILLKLSPSIVGFGITLAGGIGALANIWLARRLRSLRLRLVALAGLVGISFAISVVVLGSSLPTYLISAVIFGASGGLVTTVLATMASQVPGVARDRALSAYTVALSASLALGPFLESLVLRASGGSLKLAILSFLPLPLLASALLFLVVSDVRQSTEIDLAASFPAHVLKNPHLRQAIVALVLYQVPFVAITSFGALIADYSYGASISLAQLSFSTFFVVSLTTRSMLVWKPPGRRRVLVLRLAALVTLAGVLVLGFGHGLIWLMVAMAILGVPHGLVFPVSLSLVAASTSSRDLTKANALLFAITSSVSVVIPFVLGVIASYFGYREMSLLVFVPVFILAAMLFRTKVDTLV
ncbi:MAG: MFS transporter [Actinomycetota bacterium]|nr:MAG: MFS transporter [Actinomycetota bacterium]